MDDGLERSESPGWRHGWLSGRRGFVSLEPLLWMAEPPWMFPDWEPRHWCSEGNRRVIMDGGVLGSVLLNGRRAIMTGGRAIMDGSARWRLYCCNTLLPV